MARGGPCQGRPSDGQAAARSQSSPTSGDARLVDTAPLVRARARSDDLPGWDCLPYDRARPALSVIAERLSTLNPLQAERGKPQLLVTTASALPQRAADPFRIRQLTRDRAGDGRARRADPSSRMRSAISAPTPSSTTANMPFAARSSTSFPRASSRPAARFLRRRARKPAAVRPGRPTHHRQGRGLHLLPASEALLDADSIKRFRSATARNSARPRRRIRSTRRVRRAPDGGHGALAAAVRGANGHAVRSPRRRDLVVRDALADKAEERVTSDRRLLPEPRPGDGREPGSYRPLDTERCTCRGGMGLWPPRPIHRASPFPSRSPTA